VLLWTFELLRSSNICRHMPWPIGCTAYQPTQPNTASSVDSGHTEDNFIQCSTWQASSRRRRRSLDVSTCDLLLNRNWSFHGAVGRRLAVGRFRWQSVSLECITGQSESPRADFRHFQASFEDLFLHVILDVSHVQRIRDFLVMRYINVRFTYLLTISVASYTA